jgi:hypothetical protein
MGGRMNLSNQELEVGKLLLQLQKVSHGLEMTVHDMAKKEYGHANNDYLMFLAELKALNEAVKLLNISIARD